MTLDADYYLGAVFGAIIMMFQTDWFEKLTFLFFLQLLVLLFFWYIYMEKQK